ncbi:UDP-N-acetylmuramate dehydrogenase [Campylobacter canadensis]|uniref:UDP-N-acetylmuramate dehydrogenase n=1 Tax=Campylobacter canadensis TaxID=449520 RepID=UPI00155399C2|nr:UDP-N-acetylmuramate dehydrogenase [Campylobacter canadensis]
MIIDFSKYSSVNIGNKIEVAVLKEACKSDYYLIGLASNMLINNASNLAILDDKFAYIKDCKDYLEVGAKTKAYDLYKYAKKNDIANFEFLSSLPGQMGGLCKMNAGMKEFEIANYILELNIDGVWQGANFSYRCSDITGHIFAVKLKKENSFSLEKLELFKNMRANQPSGASFGSIFKNPQNYSAGYLIDKCNLKGFCIGGAKISEKHANFLINFNKASFDDAYSLIELCKEKVFKEFSIELIPEVVILK